MSFENEEDMEIESLHTSENDNMKDTVSINSVGSPIKLIAKRKLHNKHSSASINMLFTLEHSGGEAALQNEISKANEKRGSEKLKDLQHEDISKVIHMNSLKKNYALELKTMISDCEFILSTDVKREYLRSWTIVNLGQKANYIWPLMQYCKIEQYSISEDFCMRLYMINYKNGLTGDKEISTRADDLQLLLIKLIKLKVDKNDLIEIGKHIENDEMLGVLTHLKEVFKEALKVGLGCYYKFWNPEDRSGPKELLACMVSLIVFLNSTSKNAIYNKYRFESKFKKQRFPYSEMQNTPYSIMKMCELFHIFKTNQSYIQLSKNYDVIDYIPFIPFTSISYSDAYSAIIAIAPNNGNYVLSPSDDNVLSAYQWIITNYRIRKSMREGEQNISYRNDIMPYLISYRLKSSLSELSTSEHTQILKILNEKYRGQGRLLKLVVKEGSKLEEDLIKKNLYLPGRPGYHREKKNSSYYSGILKETSFCEIKSFFISTLNQLEKASASQSLQIINNARTKVNGMIEQKEEEEEEEEEKKKEDKEEDQDENENEEDEDEYDYQYDYDINTDIDSLEKELHVIREERKKTTSKRGRPKNAVINAPKSDADKIIEKNRKQILKKRKTDIKAIILRNLDAFNALVTSWNNINDHKSISDLFDKCYSKWYKKYLPDETTTLQNITDRINDHFDEMTKYKQKHKKDRLRHTRYTACILYAGLLFDFAIQIISKTSHLDYDMNCLRSKQNCLMKIVYRWLQDSKIKYEKRQLRRYVFLYDLAFRTSNTIWIFVSNISITTLEMASDFLYAYFISNSVQEESKKILESPTSCQMKIFAPEDF